MNNQPAGINGPPSNQRSYTLLVDDRCGPLNWPYTTADLKAVIGFSVFATSSALYEIKCVVSSCHPLEDGNYN